MFVSDCLNIGASGHLTIGGADTVNLAQKYGTPLYVMDENQIIKNYQNYADSIEKYYDGNGNVIFASKAFLCKEICRIINRLGGWLDVVSDGELYTALSAEFPAEKIVYHGNNKTVTELTMALENNVGRIVVDNVFELEILNSLASSMGKIQKIMYRIKPGIDPETHSFVRTGQIDSKFGFALQNDEAKNAVKQAIDLKNVDLVGIHCHIGSQIFDISPFKQAVEVMINFMSEIKNDFDYEISELNLGGGIAIRYVDSDDKIEYQSCMQEIFDAVKKCASEKGIKLPHIFIEPGRSMVGNAGITLYTVGGIKNIPGIRTYVSVDGGMTDNPRYALYSSEYTALIANRANEARDQSITIAGKCCESGDLIGENMPIQTPKVGDTLAVLSTGAYNFSMASNYNRIPRPAVVFVKDGQDRLAVKRQSYEDLVRNDL